MTDDETPLDYQKLQALSWRAVLRHHLSEHEMIIAGQVIQWSFTIAKPFAWVQYATDLVEVTGVPKNKIYSVLQRLVSMRALEKADVCDGYLLTLLPPSDAWPWIADTRLKTPSAVVKAHRLEAELVHATLHWPAQQDFFPPPVERELQEALAIERMRESLRSAHRAAAEAVAAGLFGHTSFPVTDRLPKPAPALQGLSSSEGPTRPLGTGQGGARYTNSSCPELLRRSTPEAKNTFFPSAEPYTDASEASEFAPKSAPVLQGLSSSEAVNNLSVGSLKGTQPGPEKGPALLRALRVSELNSSQELLDSETLKSPGTLKGTRPAREEIQHLDPGATEEEMIKWLRYALGAPVMERHGGGWREAIREDRRAVLNACYNLRLRLTDPSIKPLRSRGGWLRDEYCRLHKEFVQEEKETRCEAEV